MTRCISPSAASVSSSACLRLTNRVVKAPGREWAGWRRHARVGPVLVVRAEIDRQVRCARDWRGRNRPASIRASRTPTPNRPERVLGLEREHPVRKREARVNTMSETSDRRVLHRARGQLGHEPRRVRALLRDEEIAHGDRPWQGTLQPHALAASSALSPCECAPGLEAAKGGRVVTVEGRLADRPHGADDARGECWVDGHAAGCGSGAERPPAASPCLTTPGDVGCTGGDGAGKHRGTAAGKRSGTRSRWRERSRATRRPCQHQRADEPERQRRGSPPDGIRWRRRPGRPRDGVCGPTRRWLGRRGRSERRSTTARSRG